MKVISKLATTDPLLDPPPFYISVVVSEAGGFACTCETSVEKGFGLGRHTYRWEWDELV